MNGFVLFPVKREGSAYDWESGRELDRFSYELGRRDSRREFRRMGLAHRILIALKLSRW
jgi:hypothetical protein